MRAGAVEISDECQGEALNVPLYGTGNAANAVFAPALASGPISNDGFSDPVAVAVAGSGVFNGGPIFIADDEACVIWECGEGIQLRRICRQFHLRICRRRRSCDRCDES